MSAKYHISLGEELGLDSKTALDVCERRKEKKPSLVLGSIYL